MSTLLEEILEFIGDLWNTGNWWARAAIVSVFVPPLVALLFAFRGLNPVATAVALTPLLALIFVPLAMIDPFVIVAVAGVLGLHPTVAAVRQWLARWIPLYIGSVLAYGVYLFFVPIGNNPVLVLPLVGAVGAAAFLKLGGAPRPAVRFFGWVAFAITIAFFFTGGREAKAKVEAAEPVAAVESARGPEFTVNTGEEEVTTIVGPGTFHRIQANKDWIALSRLPDGSYREYRMRAGASSWKGGTPEGLLRVRGVENGTTLRFERVP